jgi:hypothetical protein
MLAMANKDKAAYSHFGCATHTLAHTNGLATLLGLVRCGN